MENQTPTSETKPTNEKPYNLDRNVEAAMAYILAPITGFIVLYFEKKDSFIRFHAYQSIVFGIVSFVLWQIATVTTTILIGFILLPVVSVGSFILWLLLMWKAYNNEEWEIPYLGKVARDQLNK